MANRRIYNRCVNYKIPILSPLVFPPPPPSLKTGLYVFQDSLKLVVQIMMALNSQLSYLYVPSGGVSVVSHHVQPVIFFLKFQSAILPYVKALSYLDRPKLPCSSYWRQSSRAFFPSSWSPNSYWKLNSLNTWETINSLRSRVLPL